MEELDAKGLTDRYHRKEDDYDQNVGNNETIDEQLGFPREEVTLALVGIEFMGDDFSMLVVLQFLRQLRLKGLLILCVPNIHIFKIKKNPSPEVWISSIGCNN